MTAGRFIVFLLAVGVLVAMYTGSKPGSETPVAKVTAPAKSDVERMEDTYKLCLQNKIMDVQMSKDHRNAALNSGFKLEDYAAMWAVKECAYVDDMVERARKRETAKEN
jgi:hypothetical protein